MIRIITTASYGRMIFISQVDSSHRHICIVVNCLSLLLKVHYKTDIYLLLIVDFFFVYYAFRHMYTYLVIKNITSDSGLLLVKVQEPHLSYIYVLLLLMNQHSCINQINSYARTQ